MSFSFFSDRVGDSRGRREKQQTEKDMAEELKQKEEERHKQKAEEVALGEWPTPVKWSAKSTKGATTRTLSTWKVNIPID